MNPLVSVVIPCYNVEEYIGQCLDSVLIQSYKNLEIICVDNNSTDNTLQVILNYKQKYPEQISIESESLPGAPNARNTGLALAKGEWIQFLDADDLLQPDKILNQIKLITNENNFVVGNYKTKSISGNFSSTTFETDIWDGLINNKLGITSSNLFKTVAVKEVGGWRKDLKSSQEYDLMFRLLKINENIVFDNSFNTIIQERNSGSISKKDIPGNITRLINLLLEIRNYFDQHKEEYFSKIHVANQAIFDKIRELANLDLTQALSLYQLHLPANFKPKKNSSTGFFYFMLLKIVGFRNAEKFRFFLKKNIK